MLCRRYTAQQALAMGLVNAVVPTDKLDEEVDQWCRELMAKSPSCLKILKANFRSVYDPLREGSLRNWVDEFAPDFFQSGEADEGKNAFLERREPDYSPVPPARRRLQAEGGLSHGAAGRTGRHCDGGAGRGHRPGGRAPLPEEGADVVLSDAHARRVEEMARP